MVVSDPETMQEEEELLQPPPPNEQRQHEVVGGGGGMVLIPGLGTTTPRQNDFNERTWWMVDLEEFHETYNPQGATALVARCMRVYNWNEHKTRKVLKGYRQFLTLKKVYQDWNAKILSPSYLVDQMWHQHILDIHNYYYDMMLLCGQIVGHNPDGAALDRDNAKAQRDRFTQQALRRHFSGSIDVDVWSNYSSSQELQHARRREHEEDDDEPERSIYRNPENTTADPINICIREDREDRSHPITIRVRDQTGGYTLFTMMKRQAMSTLFKKFAARKGVDSSSLRFLDYNAERIEPDSTPMMLELEHGDEIHVMIEQSGC